MQGESIPKKMFFLYPGEKSKIDKLVSIENTQSSLIFNFFYVRENRAYGFRVF